MASLVVWTELWFWVSFLISLDFQSIKGKLCYILQQVTGQKSASSAQWLWFPFICLCHWKTLTPCWAAEPSQECPILATTSKHFIHHRALRKTLRCPGWSSLIHFITSNISLGSCKQQGGFCIKKSAALDPRPQCDVNLPEISGPCRERSDSLSTIASWRIRRKIIGAAVPIRWKACLLVPVICYPK